MRSFLVPSLLLAIFCSACRPKDVVAEVGDRRVTVDDVRLQMQRTGSSADAALDALIAEETLAARAVKAGFDTKPEIRAQRSRDERTLLVQGLLTREAESIEERDLRALYAANDALAVRQVEVAQIYVALSPDATPEQQRLAMGKATTAWAEIVGGASFDDVARKYSEDLITREKGGRLGLLREGQIDRSLFEAAASLKKDEVSKPVQTPFGVHVLKALTEVERAKPSFEEVRGELAARELLRRRQELVANASREFPARRFDAALAPLRGDGG